ncbi:BLUF domain-containing protein [Acinetobacter soli]|uniref:BLUF domain-containing protein n=1 Tax=Acinetobacter soli TaxID=487316 RepID=UPI00148E29DB|nr:BLUF domain-containing protein [Acinetobacter soli]
MSLIGLMYASKTRSEHSQIKQDLMDILTEAVNFNSRHDITGVLYYGNGYFLQYLEGEKNQVETLFHSMILKDQRHKNCEVIFLESSEERLFGRWSMKFAPINSQIRDFFQKYHVDEFNPYLLSTELIPSFIRILIDQPHQKVDEPQESNQQSDRN